MKLCLKYPRLFFSRTRCMLQQPGLWEKWRRTARKNKNENDKLDCWCFNERREMNDDIRRVVGVTCIRQGTQGEAELVRMCAVTGRWRRLCQVDDGGCRCQWMMEPRKTQESWIDAVQHNLADGGQRTLEDPSDPPPTRGTQSYSATWWRAWVVVGCLVIMVYLEIWKRGTKGIHYRHKFVHIKY